MLFPYIPIHLRCPHEGYRHEVKVCVIVFVPFEVRIGPQFSNGSCQKAILGSLFPTEITEHAIFSLRAEFIQPWCCDGAKFPVEVLDLCYRIQYLEKFLVAFGPQRGSNLIIIIVEQVLTRCDGQIGSATAIFVHELKETVAR
jgi:hypothetical protein